MKHLKPAMICLCLAVTLMVVAEAEAEKINIPSKGARTEKTEEMMKPARFDHYPPMSFMSGVLYHDPHSGWKIGETPLYVSGNCVITLEGEEEGRLEEGRKAVVMGSRVGDGISALTVNVSRPQFGKRAASPSDGIKEAGSNPNVGVYVKRPE
jgi:hypothetical protein